MKSQEQYITGLKQWLADTAGEPLEEMAGFFSSRLGDYEQHMAVWEKSYQAFAGLLPEGCLHILDLGCGTGLELDQIWARFPQIEVTGVDLCQEMLEMLQKKHSDKHLTAVCMDYFQYDPGVEKWDAVISFESLHHFLPERKAELYGKIAKSLKDGGVFLLADYTACCEEEEKLLRDFCFERREKWEIPTERYVHFDIPLTLEHEMGLLKEAGLSIQQVIDEPEEATLIVAKKSS